ncbi:28459_t:CDS:2 [Racocetra persica]|uniref:28459_t:CDS:1 n=1 Tax=Racocetra persica TaxID=160502 RepID=A0ACA9M4T5_9GLOM|nr:28459_t:CDS:2 [Racocetra persica]
MKYQIISDYKSDNKISDYKSDNARNKPFLEALQSLRPEDNKLSSDEDNKLLSNKDNKHSFYMNNDEVNDINNCNELYNELSYKEVIDSSDEDEDNEFSLESYKKDNMNQVIPSRLPPNFPEIVLVTHDKSIFYANDDIKKNNEDIIKQVSKRAIPIFERTHLRKVALFMFDNSCNHNSFAEDVLLVSQMNIKDREKRLLLRNSRMSNNRGLWMLGLTRECNECKAGALTNLQCCATNILKRQPDFASQKNHLQEIIEAAGHLCIFYPKYHCELNYIESFWEQQNNMHIYIAIILLKVLKKLAYEHGLSGKAAVFAIKKYQSHRWVPESVLEEFGHIN